MYFRNVLWSVLVVAAFSAGHGSALVFESRCDSEQAWDFLDFVGDGKIFPTSDASCPPGYGPEVLHIEGGALVAMPKGVVLREGTFLVLYKENDPRDLDADGVAMVRAAYGADVSVEHNVKVRRTHVWLEQDNDTGFQFKMQKDDGSEPTLAERAGYGLVTDPWNVTRWIWQKVQVEGAHIRAKYWPAPEPEPEGWPLETDYDLPGDRFGIRINSGSIQLAYYAADTADVRRPAPPAYLFFAQPRATTLESLPLTLFLNAGQAAQETFEVTVESGGAVCGKGQFAAPVPAGPSQLAFSLAGGPPPVVKLDQLPASGTCTVRLRSADGTFAAERSFEVLPVGEMEKRFDAVAKEVGVLDAALKSARASEHIAALKVIRDAARAHCDYARQHYKAGDVDKAGMSLRFAFEALAELRGYKGAWLRELAPDVALPPLPTPPEDRRGIGEPPKEGLQNVHSPQYALRFGKPRFEAQSAVMGRTYEVVVPWSVEGQSPDRDFVVHAALVSALGNRTPTQQDWTPVPPTTQWQPGKVYEQRITLAIPPENPTPGKHLSEPVVLDEYYRLLLTVTDPKTGARLILDNEPGAQPDLVGASFLAADLYVSSTPVEIRGFDPPDAAVLNERADHAAMRNVGSDPLELTALWTVLAETNRTVYQQATPIHVDAGGETALSLTWTPDTAGDLTLQLCLLRDGVLVTEARRQIRIAPPVGFDLSVTKTNHVGDDLLTPISVQTGKGPFTVEVYADKRLAARGHSDGPGTTLGAEPWFGYYDVEVQLDGLRYDRRLVATVVETRGTDLLVNGEPFIVKGTNVHGMDPGSPERTASMMRVMRDLGFNTWRGDYPARWQVDLAYTLNTAYTVLAPYSCTSTGEIFARQDGPPLTTSRALTRVFVERYRDSAGVLLWNSCNEIGGESIDFLLSQYPVYKAFDPYERPVHYANLYGQDYWQGQDVMGTNCYFGDGQTAASRHPIVTRTLEIARAANHPLIYCEFNSFVGALHTTGADAMTNLFAWGVDQGMAGGFQYMKGNSDSHPGIFDGGFNTHKVYNDAIVRAFADAEVSVRAVAGDNVRLRIANKRRCTLRQVRFLPVVCGTAIATETIPDVAPKGAADLEIPLPKNRPGPAVTIEGVLEFTTHFGFQSRIPVRLVATL